MEEKYKAFSDKFEKLCEEYATEDFDANEVLKICDEIIKNYSN